ncbi:putative splicing factor 3b subunit 4 protein [Eutypa lata UCREL1]|uniref:Putative splicing factor 3b subunit 4 protein n=1 Tax=Eutypa lata (strain UCR-EL1) TaxID=1287681 RepID=M7SXE8_EUTLA|nr:putative splicing factor 3b subunit 4 protein [Eutypa lata UCREL1]
MSGAKHWEQDKEATVYVGNIDERAPDALIWELMVQAGPVVNVHLPKDRVTQSHQGFGFVEFNGEVDADYAAKIMNGIRLYGKPLRVNKASADKQKPLEIGAELFIGNLDSMVDEKVLYDTFSRFGTLIAPPKVARDDNGLSKGYGFVSYSSFEASDDAINNMNGQFLMNKDVSVQYAYKKDGKGERHGDEAERMLAAQAKKHNITIETQPMPPALLQTPGPAPTPQAPVVPPVMATGGHHLDDHINYHYPTHYPLPRRVYQRDRLRPREVMVALQTSTPAAFVLALYLHQASALHPGAHLRRLQGLPLVIVVALMASDNDCRSLTETQIGIPPLSSSIPTAPRKGQKPPFDEGTTKRFVKLYGVCDWLGIAWVGEGGFSIPGEIISRSICGFHGM